MPLTDPYPADVEAWLEDSIVHLYEVKILPVGAPAFEVAVDGRLELTFDSTWSPYAQARMTIKTPSDPAQEAALDPRLGTRVEINLGYRREGVNHFANVARLRLQAAHTPRPGGRTDLSAMGLEMMLQEQGSIPDNPRTNNETGEVFYADQYTDRSGVVPFLLSWIRRMYEPGPKPGIYVDPAIPGGTWRRELVAEYTHDGGTNWSAVDRVAKAAGLIVYATGLEQWRIEPLPQPTTEYAAKLRTGKRGTVTTSDTTVDRSEWYNDVAITWEWMSPDDWPIPNTLNTWGGFARVTTGPLRVTTLNRKQYRDVRQGRVSTAYADAYALGLLRTLMRRGRYRELTSVAAYWLRPGMTILTKFGRGGYDRVLVSSVTFSPLTGSMAVRTIRPEDYEVG